MDKIQENKQEKRKKILQAGYELFEETDFAKVSIDQIVRRADIAKGTFYLYFKDKVDLINALIIDKSSDIIKEAYEQAAQAEIRDDIDEIIFLMDYVIEYMRQNKRALYIIQKNLSWGIIDQELSRDPDYEVHFFLNHYLEKLKRYGYSEKEGKQLIFLILELVSTTCYSSIILERPFTIDEMKGMLFRTIRNMIAG